MKVRLSATLESKKEKLITAKELGEWLRGIPDRATVREYGSYYGVGRFVAEWEEQR